MKEQACAIRRFSGYISSASDNDTTNTDNDDDDPPAADAYTKEYYRRFGDCRGEAPPRNGDLCLPAPSN